MKKQMTRYKKIRKDLERINKLLYLINAEQKRKKSELDNYCKKHRLNFENLKTSDKQKLLKIYNFFDSKYPVEWEGGLRCDSRGMGIYFWLDDDPDFLIIHLTSTCENICFSGSTSWIVKAPELEDKIETLKKIKKQVENIIKE